MFRFIKNWFKPNTDEKVKKEYKKVPEPKDKEPKANLIARAEDFKEVDEILKGHKIVDDMLSIPIRVGQEDCPPLIVHLLGKLYGLGNQETITHAFIMLRTRLTESQLEDLANKVSQTKEYKEWKIKQRTNKLMEDFND